MILLEQIERIIEYADEYEIGCVNDGNCEDENDFCQYRYCEAVYFVKDITKMVEEIEEKLGIED